MLRQFLVALLLSLTGLHAAAETDIFISPEKYRADPPVSGQVLGDNCSACHGTRGAVFDEIMPPLAGMDRDTFIKLMLNFKFATRPSIVMNDIANAYTEDEIRRMADYFSSLPAVPWKAQSLH
ncbi:MAG TPA: hypothetical protein EYP05_05005 [Piscirickettsiaceae bacterium]|nr:hypothetical protein [Piscirickettsiaceae bacterium]HIQ40299.1 hypothetical protein [Sulfurivirga caldicuralii]